MRRGIDLKTQDVIKKITEKMVSPVLDPDLVEDSYSVRSTGSDERLVLFHPSLRSLVKNSSVELV